MSGSLGQQLPSKSSSFQNADGTISPTWFQFMRNVWLRTGGGTPTATTDTLQSQVTALNTSKVSKAGDTMTGQLVLSGAPATGSAATTRTYVDNAAALLLPKAGGTMTGALVLNANPAAPLEPATKNYTDTADALLLPKAGGTMTGALVLSGPPVGVLDATSKTYVDAADALLLPKAGGTMTGALTVPYVIGTSYTVATLPVAGAGLTSARAFVTDATAPAFNVAVVGGGAVKVPVFCDGTTWKVG